MKVKIAPLLLSVSILAATLSTHSLATSNNTQANVNFEVSQLTRSAWLREHLPENTLLYARIPSLWTSISYKEDSFKYALGNKNYTRTIQQIQKSSSEWVANSEQKIRPFLALLAGQLDGPIEIAAIAGSPMPKVIISANLNFENTAQLQELINSLIKAKVIRSESKKMQNGAGLLMTDVGPTPYRWDDTNKRLNILLNFGGADLAALDQTFASLVKNDQSPMFANEAQMDSSQQGLYVWYNNKAAYPIFQGMIPSQVKQQLTMFGVPEMESLALSWGVRNEKGRIKLQLEAPNKGMLRQVIPVNNNKLSMTTAGSPVFSAVIALPTIEEFSRIEKMLLMMVPNSKPYQQFKTGFEEKLGFKLDDIFAAIGPEVVGISDQAGEYSAIRIQDKSSFDSIIAKLTEQPGVVVTKKEVNNKTVSYMKIPSFFDAKDAQEMKDMPYFIKDVLTKVSTHLYWQVEDDYLIMADLPQVLLDRQMLLTDTTLEQWLAENQKQDLSGSTLALSGSIKQAPRRLYYAYLNAIQFLADITGAQIDTFSLPSARQLSLAQEGTLGLQIDSTEKNLSIELTFESTPADILLSSQGIASVAGIGILSAVAIPAYQEYTLKAKATSAFYSAKTAKDMLSLSYSEQGKFPDEQGIDEIYNQIVPSDKYDLFIEDNTGRVIIELRGQRGKGFEFVPTEQNGKLTWHCSSDLKMKVRPVDCKSPRTQQ